MEKNQETEKPTPQKAPVSKEPSQTMVYVSNLPFAATDEDLKDLFKEFSVKTAYVAKRRNGRSKGFGFVNLEKGDEQQGAIDKVNGSTLDGRTLTAKVAFNDPRRNDRGELKEEFKVQVQTTSENVEPSKTAVYVSNLPFSLNDEGLKKVFEDFEVKSSTVATRQNGRSMGFGFVEFNSVQDQEKALTYDKKVVDEREIAVRVAKNYLGPNRPKRPRRRKPRRPQRRPFRKPQFQQPRRDPKTTLYVSNLPFDLDHNDLTEIFSEFKVKDAYIATYRSGRSRGFGFVEFYNTQSQKDALEALDQSEVNSRVITVKVARSNRKRGPVVKRRPRQLKQREPSKTLVYVSNLPFALSDQEFSDLFKGYKVTKAYVATKRNGRSKGFGFVDFESNEEQQKALNELKEVESKGRKLTLQVANKVVEPKPEQANEGGEQNNQQPAQEENK